MSDTFQLDISVSTEQMREALQKHTVSMSEGYQKLKAAAGVTGAQLAAAGAALAIAGGSQLAAAAALEDNACPRCGFNLDEDCLCGEYIFEGDECPLCGDEWPSCDCEDDDDEDDNGDWDEEECYLCGGDVFFCDCWDDGEEYDDD